MSNDFARRRLMVEAQATANWLKVNGYPDAEVAPEYCIAGEIGSDNFFTKTISIYVGRRREKPETWFEKLKRAFGHD